MPQKKHKYINGSAILTALFIMIIVAIAATAMSLRLQIDINRSQLIHTVDQLKIYAEQGRQLMMQQLLKDGLKIKKNKKENIDPLNLQITDQPANGINRRIKIVDLQSKFDLNSLKDKKKLKPFALLAQQLLPKEDEKSLFILGLFTNEWVTKSDGKYRNLTTENFYQSQSPPYLAGQKPFVSVTEWRLVKGVTKKIFNKLLTYITALPESKPINLNTAPIQVLRTLGAGLTKAQAKKIIEARGEKGFTLLKKALAMPAIKPLNLEAKTLTLTSEYFLISNQVSSKENQLLLFTMVKRTIKKKKVSVRIIQETLNTL